MALLIKIHISREISQLPLFVQKFKVTKKQKIVNLKQHIGRPDGDSAFYLQRVCKKGDIDITQVNKAVALYPADGYNRASVFMELFRNLVYKVVVAR